MREGACGEGLLELGDSREGCCVWDVEVAESHGAEIGKLDRFGKEERLVAHRRL